MEPCCASTTGIHGLASASQIPAKKGDLKRLASISGAGLAKNPEQTGMDAGVVPHTGKQRDAKSARITSSMWSARKPDGHDARLRLARNCEVFAHDYDAAIELYRATLTFDPGQRAAIAGIDRCNGKKNNLASG